MSAPKVMVWAVPLTWNDWGTSSAACQLVSPPWEAVIEQVPMVWRVTVVPATVQTGRVVEAKLTARPEEAVAPMVNGGSLRALPASGPKVMVWLPMPTAKPWVTGGAGA